MSLTLSSAHVHTTFCDGKTPAPDMAKAAFEKGFVSLGFSSHAPQQFDLSYCMQPEKEPAYKAQIRALKAEYAGRMNIYLGTERDYYACISPDDYDYYIASVHYLKWEDGFVAIDGHADQFLSYVNEHCGGSGLVLAERYFSLLRDYVANQKPDIIGHFDLVRINNSRLRLYDEASAAYRRLALDALRPMADTGALLEVNTGGMARGYLPTPYPDAFLLKEWKAWGGEVTVTSDCHDMRLLDACYDDAEELLRSFGYDHAVRLGKTEKWERFALNA